MSNEEKVYWFTNSDENKPYAIQTWYRCMGIENFLNKVKEKNEIVGMIASGNNIGFVLEKEVRQ